MPLVAQGQTWRSSLYPESWQPPGETASFYSDKIIQDFSYAGYKHGGQPIPVILGPVFDVTAYGADPTGASDSTVAIQAAITAAGNAGGGVVYLPDGEFRVSPQGGNPYCLRIARSNVVLRGAGASSTFLLCTATNMRGKSVIDVVASVSSGSAVALTADLPGPTRRLPVATPSSFSVGDFAKLEWGFTDAWVAEHNQQAYWNATKGYPSDAEYLREVVAVNESEGWIEVDVPTRYSVKTRDYARVTKQSGFLTGVGIESLAIGNLQHPGTTWGEGDYNTSGTAAYDAHGSWLVEMRESRDCWITGVESYLPSGNTTTCHMLSNGLVLDGCFRVTVKDCRMGRPQFGGGGGNGYMYRLRNANDCLLQSCVSDLSRHGFVISHAGTSGNVFLQCDDRETGRAMGASSTPYSTSGSGSDNHMHFSHSNLWDNCSAHNSFYTASHRTTSGTVPHGLTSAHAVYWNTSGSGTRYSNIVLSAQGRYGYVIGTSGSKFGASNPTTGNTAPADHLEGIGSGATLEPASLYLDQLSRRLNPEVTYDANGATSGTAPVDANNPYAAGATVTVPGAGDLVKMGFTFNGWNTAADGSGTGYVGGNTFTIDHHVTLYAQWLGAPHVVSFDGNGGSAPEPMNKEVNLGSAYGTLATTSRSGYSFLGWFTVSSGGTEVTSSTTVSANSNHTLYAQWGSELRVAPAARHTIRGETEDETNLPVGYSTSSVNMVGTGGPSGSREDRVAIFGYALPTLPVGTSLGAATLNFEITAARDSTGGENFPDLQVYLLDTADPSGTGTGFFHHGTLDANANARQVGATSVTITGTEEVSFTSGQEVRSFTLSGAALDLLRSYYDGPTPKQSMVYFRFNMSEDPLITTYRRYRVSTATDGSSLELTSIAPPNSPPTWNAVSFSKPDARQGDSYAGSIADDATDDDGDTLTFAKVDGPEWLSVSADGTLSGTPTGGDAGSNSFTVSVRDAGSTAVQATLTITVISAFDGWVSDGGGSGVTFSGDANGDGVADGVAWLLGSPDPAGDASGLLPASSGIEGGLTLSFKVLNSGKRGSALMRLQYSSDLGATDPWADHTVPIPDESGTLGGVQFVVTPIAGTDLYQVEATIPGAGNRIFARVGGELPTQ